MRLTDARVLEGVAQALREQVAPHLEDGFAADAARIAQALVLIAGRAGDDAAALRVAENAGIRALLGRGAALVEEADLAQRLRAAAASSDPGLRISQLDAETGRLRLLLVELHARIEEAGTPTTRRLDQDIWAALREFEMARAPRA